MNFVNAEKKYKNVWQETTKKDEEKNNQNNDKTIGITKNQGYRGIKENCTRAN
ncbi:MAG: hypothetical protein ACLU6Y_01600 [Ruminococcus sp.]